MVLCPVSNFSPTFTPPLKPLPAISNPSSIAMVCSISMLNSSVFDLVLVVVVVELCGPVVPSNDMFWSKAALALFCALLANTCCHTCIWFRYRSLVAPVDKLAMFCRPGINVLTIWLSENAYLVLKPLSATISFFSTPNVQALVYFTSRAIEYNRLRAAPIYTSPRSPVMVLLLAVE